jgi:hypothetical protein
MSGKKIEFSEKTKTAKITPMTLNILIKGK